MSSKQQAVVKWFDHVKGWGFLITPNGDAFVHYRDIQPDKTGYKYLSQGQRVEYEPITTGNGLTAKQVMPVL